MAGHRVGLSRQAIEETAVHAAQRLIGDLHREANGEPAILGNEGFSPELVVRGSTGPWQSGASKR